LPARLADRRASRPSEYAQHKSRLRCRPWLHKRPPLGRPDVFPSPGPHCAWCRQRAKSVRLSGCRAAVDGPVPHGNRFAPKVEFREAIQCFSAFRPIAMKISLSFYRISAYHKHIPPPREGRFAIVTSAGSGMRWTREPRQTCDAFADGQVVWSWRPWAGAKFVGDDPANDGDYEVTDTGESTKQPLTPSRRECRCFGFTCGEFACVLLHFAHKAAGAAKHPAFPAPSSILRDEVDAKLGRNPRRGNAESCPLPSLRGAKRRPVYARCASCAWQESAEALLRAGGSNPECSRGEILDCFAESVIGRAFARPVGSQ